MSFHRIIFSILILISVVFNIIYIHAYSIRIKGGERSCYFVKTIVGVPITGSYEVILPDPDFISVEVHGPTGYLHFSKKSSEAEDQEEAAEGFFSFDSDISGDYTMCIYNGHKDNNDGIERLVAFNFRAIAQGENDYEFVGLQSELTDLSEGLELLKDHQSYMNQREDVHKDTLDSINVKLLCWTVLESVILVSMALWQIVYIRSFFEIKRRI